MARRYSFSEVRGGLFAVIAILSVAFATLEFSRVGALHGPTFNLYALVGEARGVLVGSEVWLSGQKVGKITAIKFRPPTASDTSTRIEITMAVLEKYRSAMHRDGVAQIENGGTIIGAPVVYMTPGTIASPALRPGDTVNTHPQSDVESTSGRFGAATSQFPIILNNVKMLMTQLQATQGTIGAFINTPGGAGAGQIARARSEGSEFAARMSSGGSIGEFMQGGLTTRTKKALARADSVRILLASSSTSYGRLRRDSTLIAEVADVRNELSIVRVLLDEPRGTAGRALHDSATLNAVADAERQMSLLTADIKQHPLRYLSY
jgi:ABC-type transporter Mla subunit MlaD